MDAKGKLETSDKEIVGLLDKCTKTFAVTQSDFIDTFSSCNMDVVTTYEGRDGKEIGWVADVNAEWGDEDFKIDLFQLYRQGMLSATEKAALEYLDDLMKSSKVDLDVVKARREERRKELEQGEE